MAGKTPKAKPKPKKATKSTRATTPVKPAKKVKGKLSNPKGQTLVDGRPVKTVSTFSPRLLALRSHLEGHLKLLFGAKVEQITAYNMHGWRIPRPKPIAEWTGTIDPNYIHMFLAERKAGITLHLWNPYEPLALKKRAKALSAAGLKVMVGCMQYNRKSDFPVAAVLPLLESMAAEWKREH